MQPYFFPYIGYFQLIYSVDEFIIYDDVNYFKKGHINRNYILLNEKRHRFSIPIKKASQNRLIMDHKYLKNQEEFLDKIKHAYSRSPYFNEAFEIIKDATLGNSSNVSIKNYHSIKTVLDYLGINKKISFSSNLSSTKEYKGENRIISICKEVGATSYNNTEGGSQLYNKLAFKKQNIELMFIRTNNHEYKQLTKQFQPSLSIIDVLMQNDKKSIKKLLEKYELF